MGPVSGSDRTVQLLMREAEYSRRRTTQSAYRQQVNTILEFARSPKMRQGVDIRA